MFRLALNVAGRPVVRQSAPRSHKMFDRLGVQGLPRDFSARGTRPRPPAQRLGHQKKRTQRSNQGAAAVCAATAIGVLMVWESCQDEAPYTDRRRFMIVNRDGDLLRKIGAMTWTSVKQQHGPLILPKAHPASRTVERIGARIAQASGLEGCKWEFIVVKNDAMNAFALPGGKVVVFTGLFEATPNSASLASVLGHEVGHVVANHGGEKLSKSFLKEGLMLLLFAVTGFDDFHAARSLGHFVFDLPNSREMEREADYIGMQLMAKACFDPHEMPKTFSRMKAVSKKKGVSKGPAYLSTHPADDERISKQNEWMDSAVQEYERSGCSTVRQEFAGMMEP